MRPDTGVLPRGGVIPAGTGPGLGPVTQGSEVCSPLSRFPCGRPGLCLPASFPYLPAGDNGGEGRGGEVGALLLLLLLHPLLLPRRLPLTPGCWESLLGRSLVPRGKFFLAPWRRAELEPSFPKRLLVPSVMELGSEGGFWVGRPALTAQKSPEFWCCSAGGWPKGRPPRCVGARHPKWVAVQRAGRCLRSFWGVLAWGGQSERKGGDKILVWGRWCPSRSCPTPPALRSPP